MTTAKTKASTRKAAPKLIADQAVNQTEMAAILGISTRMLRIYVADGVIEKQKATFPIGQTVRAYADHLKNGSAKKSGNTSMDALRDEKTKEIRMNRARKERELIPIDEALATHQELIGMFSAYLTGLPAEMAKDVRERRRLEDIIDVGKQRLADRLAKRLEAVRDGEQAADAEAED